MPSSSKSQFHSKEHFIPLNLLESSPGHSSTGLVFNLSHRFTPLLNTAISNFSNKRQALKANKLAFASINGGPRLWGWKQDECIRSTFNSIDRDRKGHITEADLAAYAAEQRLPATYVRPFLDAVLQQQQQQQQPGSLRPDSDLDGEVGYAAFKEFVLSREEGLREAFSHFDIDGDGSISADDLAVSLARVAICSPASSCVMRPRHQVVADLLERLQLHQDRRVSFAEFRKFFMLLPAQGQLVEYWLSGCRAVECADMGGHFSIVERRRSRGSPWGHLLAGAVAGAASRSATAPLETIRLAAMAGTLPPGTSMLSAGRALVAGGGVASLYRGNLVNVMRSAPARAVDFFAFDLFKAWFGSDSYAATFTAAGLAGTFSWALLYPLEVLRSRLTLDTAGMYKGMGHAIATMAAAEGPRAFYRGLGPSLAAIAPEAAITYGLHDLLKRAYHNTFREEPGVAASLWCGVFAAWSGQLVAFPLETVSRRMQLAGVTAATAAAAAAGGTATAATCAAAAAGGGGAAGVGAAGGAAGSLGVMQMLSAIMKEGGPAALYRGIGAATLRLVPSAIISFGTYELMRKLLLDIEARQEVARARAQCQQLHKVLSSAQRCNQQIQQLQSQQGAEAIGQLLAAPGAPVCAVCDAQGNVRALPAGSCSISSDSSNSSSDGSSMNSSSASSSSSLDHTGGISVHSTSSSIESSALDGRSLQDAPVSSSVCLAQVSTTGAQGACAGGVKADV